MEVITSAGKALKAQKQAVGEPLIINQFILANIVGQNHEDEIDRTRGLPEAKDIVYTAEVTRAAYVAESEVVYSLFMGTGVGGFSFNTLYLVCTEDNNTVFAIATLPETAKIADDIDSGTRGTSMTRNFALAFGGAQAVTQLTLKAEAWQMKFMEAKEAVQGITEIATDAETQAGLDDQRIVTPLKLSGSWDSARQWDNVKEKPSKYTPIPHVHGWSDLQNVPVYPIVDDIRLGTYQHHGIWYNYGINDSAGLLITAVANDGNTLVDAVGGRPFQQQILGNWYTVEFI